MADKEQVKPLSSPYRLRSDEEEPIPVPLFDLQHRRYILCFGCFAATLLIVVTVILVLFFTVLHIKDPVMRINEFTIQGFELFNSTTIRPDVNVTLSAELSVKNPNAVSLKFDDTTTSVYYGGVLVGQAKTVLGKAKARRTVRVDVAVDIDERKMVAVPSLRSDLGSSVLTLSSSTRIVGKVKILNKDKFVAVAMNCTMTYNVTNQAIQQERRCKRV
ncbi:putative Late embryogenesis abundant hydroxyproline-rich glycoprotein family [Tripterygium wilfordii]|uniref:Putative Late embryogenesis abundant hydroxyproline-rich glycoprotein family n=1 Tax=Tripterygium wilfordii TaxID=458696 RepID=A0A7J7CL75_TRIWF|nr:late embryogenesis abundant protein At1g64065 [Tripterygium wilfordii]KAF5734789.1 putative Late embryogenesis abundant hydroxyproline-rich glycoprotein family [Tripterygium wilfordii]